MTNEHHTHAVKFLKTHVPYKVNQVASFTKDFAEKLIRLGVAVPYEPTVVVKQHTVSIDNSNLFETPARIITKASKIIKGN